MGPIDVVTERMPSAQRCGDAWRAQCPCCGGRSRKVSIRETADGRVLLHCFGGCDALSILQAVGLTLSDLYPTPIASTDPHERRNAARRMRQLATLGVWGAALDTLDFEARVVLIAAGYALRGEPLSPEDYERLQQAQQRIEDARAKLRPADLRDILRPLAVVRTSNEGAAA